MKILIVHAHYEPQSFNAALKDTAVTTLTEAGHDVKVSDLYAMNWNPVVSRADFAAPSHPDYCVYALEQRKGFEVKTLSEDIRTEVEKVQWCDLLILNFPIFWFSAPAILKGWIDRVFVSGQFYGGKRIYDKGGMVGKKALVTLTLGGQEHMFGPDAIHGEMQTMLRPILRGSLAYCGFSVLPPHVAYHVPYVSQDVRQTMLLDYQARLRHIEQDEALIFPHLGDFDEKFYPKTSCPPLVAQLD